MLRGRLLGRDSDWPHLVVVFVLDDVAVVNVTLRRCHARRQIKLRADPSEIARIGFHCVLETALCRVGRFLWPRRKWTRIVPAGDSVRALEFLLVGLDVKRGPTYHLELDQMNR